MPRHQILHCSFLLLLLFPSYCFCQCLTISPPTSCTGTEALVSDNESLDQGTTKWYYGASASFNSLTMNGGTLIVCGDLSVSQFYMDSGTIYIAEGARFEIGGGIGAGLVLKGNSRIYNFGTLECVRNLSLDNGYATATEPNVIINAIASSVFRMANQYFVINNQYSWFVNNGDASFWGLITDAQSSPGSVCLGDGSTTTMSTLINRTENTYVVPYGHACIYVNQYSQFYQQLTDHMNLFVCLGASHTSDAGCIPFGCIPDAWGNAQVFEDCVSCHAVYLVPVKFTRFSARRSNGSVLLKWTTDLYADGYDFYIQRSVDGINFHSIDSFSSAGLQREFDYTDHQAASSMFYRIRCSRENLKSSFSKIISVGHGNEYPLQVTHSGRGYLKIEAGRSSRINIQIRTPDGRLVFSGQTFTDANGNASWQPDKTLPPGIFLMQLTDGERYKIIRIPIY